MGNLFRALGSLLMILALTASVRPQAHVVTNHDVISQARSAYYSLTKKGFKGFTATVEPNWKVILAHTATPKNLKVFGAVRFTLVVDAKGTASLRHEVNADAAKPDLVPVVEQIQKDLQRLVAGFFNTWRMFVVGSPFPETANQIKIENLGAQYLLTYPSEPGEIMIVMTRDFLINEWKLSGPLASRTVKPHFQKTVDGFLLTGYQGVFEPVGDGIKTTLDFNIEYQDVSGLRLPHKVLLKGMHGSEPVEAEIVFRVIGE